MEEEEEGEELEGCAISLSTIPYPPCVPSPLSYPFSNLQGRLWRMQSRSGGEIFGPVYEGNKGTLEWQHLQPSPPVTFRSASLPAPPVVPVRCAVVEFSKVHWRYPLAACTISLYPAPQWPPRSNSHGAATFDMLSQRSLYAQRLKLPDGSQNFFPRLCLTNIQVSNVHLIGFQASAVPMCQQYFFKGEAHPKTLSHCFTLFSS